MEESMRTTKTTAIHLQSVNSELQLKILDLEMISKQEDDELSAPTGKVEKRSGIAEQTTGGTHEDSDFYARLLDKADKMKHELESSWRKNTELETQIEAKDREISDYLRKLHNMEKELGFKTAEHYKLKRENGSSRADINNLCSTECELEKQIASKDLENAYVRQELHGLDEKNFMLERMLQERDDQLLSLQKKFEQVEDDKSAQIVTLMAQVEHLEEDQLNNTNHKINQLLNEKELLHKRISELEYEIEHAGDDIPKVQDDMSTQIGALTLEVNQDAEMNMKRKMDELIRTEDAEINQLREDKKGLQNKILDMEITMTDRGDVISRLQRELHDKGKETSAIVSSLRVQMDGLQKEKDDEVEKFKERQTQMENQIFVLTSKIADQELMIKQQEVTINRLHEDAKLIKGRFLQAAERKMDDMAEEFRKNFEDKLRLLGQRIRVAEQLHGENKDGWKKIQEKCEQEHSGLEKKVGEYSKIIVANNAEITKISKAADEMVTGMGLLILKKFEDEEGSFLRRLSKISDELQVIRDWVRSMINATRQSKSDAVPSSAPLGDDKEYDKSLKERMEKLEAKVNMEKGDRVRLMRGMYEFQKKMAELERLVAEKEAGIVRLGMEKVEAIKQLSMSIDYHYTRCNNLREMLLESRTRSRGGA